MISQFFFFLGIIIFRKMMTNTQFSLLLQTWLLNSHYCGLSPSYQLLQKVVQLLGQERIQEPYYFQSSQFYKKKNNDKYSILITVVWLLPIRSCRKRYYYQGQHSRAVLFSEQPQFYKKDNDKYSILITVLCLPPIRPCRKQYYQGVHSRAVLFFFSEHPIL